MFVDLKFYCRRIKENSKQLERWKNYFSEVFLIILALKIKTECWLQKEKEKSCIIIKNKQLYFKFHYYSIFRKIEYMNYL